MKFEISTSTFQEMVNTASKGAGNNKQIPLTNLMGIRLFADGTLRMTTTDGTNYLYVTEQEINGEEGYVTIQTDTLVKLAPKITSDTVELELTDKVLLVKGNGTYKIEIPMDENGVIEYPDPVKESNLTALGTVNLVDIKTILSGIRPSLATTYEVPFYMHYYVGDKVVGTNQVEASSYNKKLIDAPCEPMLLNANMVNLLDSMTASVINVLVDGAKIMFKTDDIAVFGTMPSGIEDYAIDAINGLLSQDFPYTCQVSRDVMLGALDRIKLFVGTYDENAITLKFSNNKVTVSSKLMTGIEDIPYMHDGNGDFECKINVNSFFTHIHSQTSDTVTIAYGIDKAIKLVGDDIVTVIALYI